MYKVCLAILFAAPIALCAQAVHDTSSSSWAFVNAPETSYETSDSITVAGVTMATPQTNGSQGFFERRVFAARTHDTPAGSFTASYVYQFAPDYVGADRSLMGWSATPEVNFTKYLGLQTEFTSLYMRSVYPGQSRFLIAAGPRITLAPHSKLTPFAFAEGGQIRSTQQLSDVTNWDTAVTGGIGFDYKISRGLAFQLIPGEYVGEQLDNGEWNHSFMSKAGITFNLFR